MLPQSLLGFTSTSYRCSFLANAAHYTKISHSAQPPSQLSHLSLGPPLSVTQACSTPTIQLSYLALGSCLPQSSRHHEPCAVAAQMSHLSLGPPLANSPSHASLIQASDHSSPGIAQLPVALPGLMVPTSTTLSAPSVLHKPVKPTSTSSYLRQVGAASPSLRRRFCLSSPMFILSCVGKKGEFLVPGLFCLLGMSVCV